MHTLGPSSLAIVHASTVLLCGLWPCNEVQVELTSLL